MLRDNFTLEQISRLTGLTMVKDRPEVIAQIQQLQGQLEQT